MPNKAVSASQWRFFKDVAEGSFKAPGLPSHKAAEMISGQSSPKGLPEKAAALDRIAKRHRPNWGRAFKHG